MVITVGLVGVLSLVVVDRNDSERLSAAEEAGETLLVSSPFPIIETRKTRSLGGDFGSSVRGTVGRMTGFGFVSRRVRLDNPVRHCQNMSNN